MITSTKGLRSIANALASMIVAAGLGVWLFATHLSMWVWLVLALVTGAALATSAILIAVTILLRDDD